MQYGFVKSLFNSGLYNTENDVIKNGFQLSAALTSWLKSAQYPTALACQEVLMENWRRQKGTKEAFRDDGKTPNFLHQASLAVYTISMIEDGIYLKDPESVLALDFIHDEGENLGIKPHEMQNLLISLGAPIKPSLDELIEDYFYLSKHFGDPDNPLDESGFLYYETLKTRRNGSIVKPKDRIHNLKTMPGVKDKERTIEYALKTAVIINDYIKDASTQFPSQKEAYKAAKKIIDAQVQMIAYLSSLEELEKPLPPDDEIIAERMPERGFNVPNGLNPILITAARLRETYPTLKSNSGSKISTPRRRSEFLRTMHP